MTGQDQPTSQPEAARIQARSRRLAMDWSLVLASQGIQTVIQNDPELGWLLVVNAEEHPRALEAIKLYRVENLRWPWRRPILKQRLVFDWAALVWTLMLILFHSVVSDHPDLQTRGVMDTSAFANGEWWRAFTAIWLHNDVAHLISNAVFGFVLLGLAMGHFGTGAGILAAYLAGAAGNALDWIVHGSGHNSLGASGMVMGALGLVAMQSFSMRHELMNARRYAIVGVSAGAMLFVMFGLTPGTDVIAHFGGFLAGLLFGALLSLRPTLTRDRWLNSLALVILAVLIMLPWRLA